LDKLKRIGILGGMSYESTIKYYDLILQKYYKIFRDYNYPEIVIFSLNFQKLIDLELGDDEVKYINYLMTGINSLDKAGANFIIMAANSPHAVFNHIVKRTNVPILSIVKYTAEKASQEHLKKLLLLGIKYTMQSSFYQDFFEELNMNLLTPSIEEQDEIDRIIFKELVLGNFKQESKQKILKIINNYEIDGVILGCTELPLILNQKDTDIRLLDTVEIHTDAALEYYLSLD
jgi:aspartate racemase